jgi:hypothetical protein
MLPFFVALCVALLIHPFSAISGEKTFSPSSQQAVLSSSFLGKPAFMRPNKFRNSFRWKAGFLLQRLSEPLGGYILEVRPNGTILIFR